MRINLFGNLRISIAGNPVNAVNSNRMQSLIAYLILHPDAQPRERLAFLLWPSSTESQARTNLRQLLHHLKRALPAGENSLEISHFAVRWAPSADCSTDTVDFLASLANANSARAENDRMREVDCLTSAEQLYEDDLLPGLYDEWLRPLRQEYRDRISEALQRLAVLYEAQHEYSKAIPRAERLVALDPLNESHYQLLMRLHAANHDRASALRAYHRCMRVLRRELAVEPGPATVELFERILRADLVAPGEPAPRRAAPPAMPQQMRALVGRAKEWQQLVSVWRSAGKEGPRVAVVSGEPGIGKTRLADELFHQCLREGHAAARTRCYMGLGQVAYAPVADWLRSDALRAEWPRLSPEQAAELARLVPEIRAQFAGAEPLRSGETNPLTESWQRLGFYDSIRAAVEKCSKPLLLYLDDAQWCDPDSLEWLQSLLTSPASTGMLVLLTVRVEETDRDHPFSRFVAGLRQLGIVDEIPLEPLDAEGTAELARIESAKPLASGNLDEIFRTTRGNPLFVLESVRAGLQSTRVHAVISSRLAQLTAPSYDLAGLASVIGRPFTFGLLEKATDWDEASLSRALDELWRRRIIEHRGVSEYDFTHDRLREVAFAELTLVRQRYWHRRVARALCETYAADIESWDGQIASHFEQAGMAEEAIEHYWRAASLARQRYADAEAAALLGRTLALCRSLPESARRLKQELDLLAILGPVLVSTEGYSAAEVGATYDRALALSAQLAHRNIFPILSGAWGFHTVRGEIGRSHSIGLEFLAAAEREPTAALLLAGNFIVGCSFFHLGRLDASQHHLSAAFGMHTGHRESILAGFAGPDLGVFCRAYMAHLAWHRGAGDEAETHAREAVAAAEHLRHPFSRAIALNYAAILHVFQGDSRLALERGLDAVELCKSNGFKYYLAMANVLTGWAKAAEGDVHPGLLQLREGLEELRRLAAELRLPFYLTLLAETLGRAGQTGEALANISTAFAFATKNGEEWAVPEIHRVQGDLLLAEGGLAAARASYLRAVSAARQIGSTAFENRSSSRAAGTAESASLERF